MYSVNLETTFNKYKEHQLHGRYITNPMIETVLNKLDDKHEILTVGNSVEGLPIHAVKIGSGTKRILMWSQMHGNESTTTKAIFDLFNYLNEHQTILDSCSLFIVPILNPDGAKYYTRLNANAVDLNRDAKNLSQPESLILRKCFDDFKPDFCFNLHGQRTIFSVGETAKSATVSFLSPAANAERSLTKARKIAMELIVAMADGLQKVIPNQIALYDDGYNVNCVGDAFQTLGVPTVLFEAGHIHADYSREVTRKYIFQALVMGLETISTTNLEGLHYSDYMDIPDNGKCFLDIIIRNAKQGDELVDIGVLYKEKLENGTLKFVPIIEKLGNLKGFYGHKEFNANKASVLNSNGDKLEVGSSNDFVMLNNSKYSLLVD
ncbi:M14 family metallopeptidase [Bizionia sp. KMM 8389]